MKLRFILFVVCLFNYSVSSLAIAESVNGKTKELTRIQKKIKAIGRKIDNLNTKKSLLLAELKKLDVQYGKSSAKLKNLEENVTQLNKVLEKNRQEMHVQQQEINSQKKVLESQVKVAYGMGRNEKLKLLLSQKAPSVSSRMLVYYDYLNQARLQKINKINKGLHSLQDLDTEYLREADNLHVNLELIKEDREVLLKTKSERKALLAKINKRFSLKKEQLSQFKISEKKLKALILSLQQTVDDFPYEKGSSENFGLLKGRLPWPIQGKIVKRFGAQRSDSRWDGVLLDAKEGAEIRAVARGRIVYADWLRGYGLLTIIDHGKGYMTLYAFNQSLYKKVDDWVDPGTVIASVGQSGGQPDSGLYFGIRKKGKPIDPVKWCRKNRRR